MDIFLILAIISLIIAICLSGVYIIKITCCVYYIYNKKKTAIIGIDI